MAEDKLIGAVQGSIHETLRLLLPGYFALFLFFTLYPDVFYGREIIFTLGGGVLFGILINGFSFHNKHIIKNEKIIHMLDILKKGCIVEVDRVIEEFTITTSELDKDRNMFKKMYFLFNCFSYGDVPNTIRERQRLYASLYYLYANCYWLLIIYLSIVILFYPVLLIKDIINIPINIMPYYYNIYVNIFVAIIVSVFIYLLWRKADGALDNSMWFQKIFMKYYKDVLIRNVGNVLKWDYGETV